MQKSSALWLCCRMTDSPPSASVRILTLLSQWAEISWAGWCRLGHSLEPLALSINCIWDLGIHASRFSTSFKPTEGVLLPHTQTLKWSCSEPAQRQLHCSSVGAELCPGWFTWHYAAPKDIRETKIRDFQPFHLFCPGTMSTEIPNSAQSSTDKQSHYQLSMSTDPSPWAQGGGTEPCTAKHPQQRGAVLRPSSTSWLKGIMDGGAEATESFINLDNTPL